MKSAVDQNPDPTNSRSEGLRWVPSVGNRPAAVRPPQRALVSAAAQPDQVSPRRSSLGSRCPDAAVREKHRSDDNSIQSSLPACSLQELSALWRFGSGLTAESYLRWWLRADRALGKWIATGRHTHRIPRPVLTPRQGSGHEPSCVGRPCRGAAAGRWGWGSPASHRWLPPLPPSAARPSGPVMPGCWSTWPRLMPSLPPPPCACSGWGLGRSDQGGSAGPCPLCSPER